MMSSSEKVITTLENLMEVEDSALEVYRELLDDLTDEKLKDVIRKHIKAEKHHKKLIEEALDLTRRA
jgi:rubrerythrin